MRMEFIGVLMAAGIVIADCTAEERPNPAGAPPRMEISDTRRKTQDVLLPDGYSVPVDQGIEWQGVKAYLSTEWREGKCEEGSLDLVGVDTKSGQGLWAEEVCAYWKQMTFKEVEPEPGKKVWAVELRPKENKHSESKLAEYHDLKTGKLIVIPGVSGPPGDRLEIKKSWSGSVCAVGEPFNLLISTPENWEKFVQRMYGESDYRETFFDHQPHRVYGNESGTAGPEFKVDFAKEVALVVSIGNSGNSFGVYCREAYEDANRSLIRVGVSGYQSMGRWGGGSFARPYGIFVLPRRDNKAYIVEENQQNYIGAPPNWKEIFRAALADPAKELAALPPPHPAGRKPQLPADFKREIQHYKTPPPKKSDDDLFMGFGGADEYDFYMADGKKVLHGPYRVFRRENDDKERNEYAGNYEDGLPHGVWKQWYGNGGVDDEGTLTINEKPGLEFSETYSYGQLHGPTEGFNENGTPSFRGQFEHGKADGLWTYFDYYSKGQKLEEQVFDHGLLHGASITWDPPTGVKIEERNYVKGQLDGPYTRWHTDGKLATKGGFIAGEHAPDNRYADYNLPHPLSLRGLRQGEWVHYACDGKELWRGTFDHGTGTLVEFRDDGSKWLEVHLVRGERQGEYKTWDPKGWLDTREEIDADDNIERTVFYADGRKHSETHWRHQTPMGIHRYWDEDGNIEAECLWENGKPLSGDTLDERSGAITHYNYGRAIRGNIRFTGEARRKQEQEKLNAEQRKLRGLEFKGNIPLRFVTPEQINLDRQTETRIEKLRSPAEAERAEAAKALVELGAGAVPALASKLYDRDPELCLRVRQVLEKIKGAPGAAENGMAFSAIPAGPRPQPGECAPFWITLANTGNETLYVFKHMWTLYLHPQHEFGASMILTGANDPGWEPFDYLKLAPGESYSALMDADPAQMERARGKFTVSLNVTVPEQARKKAPGKLYMTQGKAVSAPFEFFYREDEPDPNFTVEVFQLKNDEAGENTRAVVKAGAKAIDALRLGLHAGSGYKRWTVFQFACKHPLQELEDDLVAFWGRFGNNWTTGDTQEALYNFSKCLPAERRLAFLERTAAAKPDGHHDRIGLIHYLSGGSAAEKSLGVKYSTALYDLGFREYSHLNFLAWEHARGEDMKQRDLPLAVKLAKACVAAKADYADGWQTLSAALLDSGEFDEALKAAKTALELKSDPEFEGKVNEALKKLGRAPLEKKKGEAGAKDDF